MYIFYQLSLFFQIYALNKVMTENENSNFHNFINEYGLNIKDKSKKTK